MYRTGTTTRIHRELPIFRVDGGENVVLYAPGWARLSNRSQARQVEQAFMGANVSTDAKDLARDLIRQGLAALRAWDDLATKPFEPECLTLYLSNRCNLGCTYCYSMPEDNARARARSEMRNHTQVSSFHVLAESDFPQLSEEAVAAAAQCVAGYCAVKAKPLTLVMHGGGEPTMHWELLNRAWSVCSNVARKNGIRMWSYLATHGVLAESRVQWLARHFDLVGLSCDGPPDIQNLNRPSTTGGDTSQAVERTARILHNEGADCTLRATVTPATVSRQAEIVHYLCDRLFARAIKLEPAYDGRRAPGGQFHPDDADIFVSNFIEAQEIARSRGCDLQLSGVRLNEIHGPFCNPLRDVLQIMPDGRASACFLSVGNDEAADEAMAIGRLDPATGDFVLNNQRASSQRLRAAQIPPQCRECQNIYHCARDCPDVCLLNGDAAQENREGFRCRVQKLFAVHSILKMADSAASHDGAILCSQ